jgi:WD40 repeat protein
MPLAQFVPLFEYVAEVVHAAHVRGIVHRDLKPSNVMVAETGGRLLPKLLDFGIAKLFDAPDAPDEEPPDHVATTARLRNAPPPDRTRTSADPEAMRLTPRGAVLGSAPYMSPEQWCDPWSVGPATDVYALGCLAHETLTGRTPFEAADARGYCDRHLRAEVPTLAGAFPPGVDRAIRRALEKSPEARHRSALDFAAEFRAALRAEPREQLRSAAQQWEDRERSPGFLWGPEGLVQVERSVPQSAMSELECSFVAASTRRARRGAWMRRALAVVAVASAVGWLQYRSVTRSQLAQQESRAARDLAETKVTDAEREQGRAALLHGELEALPHLSEAYRRDPAPATAFMLARAMEPRLAEEARFASTHGRMWSATYSPDHSQIATTDDRAAQVWDARTHRLLFTLPHGCEVYQAAYSPDGARLVTVAQKMVRIWDAKSGTLILDLDPAAGGRTIADLYRVAVAPDGRLVAAMDVEGAMALVWDSETGALVAELPNNPDGYPRLAFSRDGRLVTTGGFDARVFDSRTWRPVLTVPGPVRGVAFDAGSRLVTGTATGEVAVWDAASGAKLRILRSSGEPVEAVAFSPNGESVAAGSRDGTMQVWLSRSGARRSQLNPRRSKILAIEFDPASEKLLAANADGTVVVAEAASGLPLAVLDGPQSVVRAARFGSSSEIVGASWDGTVRVWKAESPYRRWNSAPEAGDCGLMTGAKPDGRFIAVRCGALPTRIWDTAQGRLVAELPSVTPIASGGYASAFPAVSAEGHLAAIARGDAVEVYDLPGRHLVRRIRHGGAVSAVAFAERGRAIVSGGDDGSVVVTREDGTEFALQVPSGVDIAELLPDGRVVVSDAERHLRVHAPDGALLAEVRLPVRMRSLRREGGRLVAIPLYTVGVAPPVLIDLERYQVVAELGGHVGQVLSARWVAGGRILTAGADGTARLWDGATGGPLKVYRGGPRLLADATLEGALVIAGDADGLLRFWDAESGERLWTLHAHRSSVIGIHLEGTDIVTRGYAGEISRWTLPDPQGTIEACARRRCAIVPP